MRTPKILILLAFVVCNCSSPGNRDKPNILFIYTDDQSTRTISAYPEAYPWVNTPNIDALAEEGVLFTHAYIGSWCMPSRATMLTGLHQHAIESMRMEGQYPGSTYNPALSPFWPSVFRENGYTTAQIGKWHTGTDTGFGRDWDFQKVWNRPRYPDNANHYYYHQLIETNGGEAELVKGYSTDNYTDWAIDFIRGGNRDKEKPWYLWLCYGAVHGPFTPADRHLHAYPDIPTPEIKDIYPPRPGKPQYANQLEFWEPDLNGIPVEKKRRGNAPVGMKDLPGRPLKDWIRQYQQGVLAIDEGVGRIINALEESGQDKNTIIVFTSDQGFAWGQHGSKNKVAPYHANIGAPLIFKFPDSEKIDTKGKLIDHPVSGVDLPVTFFSLAGLPVPWKMHGNDLSPLLNDPETDWKHPAMVVHTGQQFGSDTDIIPDKNNKKLYHGPGIPWYVMLSRDRYKYVRYLLEGETEELYDLVNDPEELNNLVSESSFQEILDAFRRETIEELEKTDAGFVNNLPAS